MTQSYGLVSSPGVDGKCAAQEMQGLAIPCDTTINPTTGDHPLLVTVAVHGISWGPGGMDILLCVVGGIMTSVAVLELVPQAELKFFLSQLLGGFRHFLFSPMVWLFYRG